MPGKNPADATSPDSAPPPKRSGGAPRGNRNAEKSGRHGKRLSRLKLDHNARLDSYEQEAVDEAKAILQELLLDDAAIGTALGRQYARLEVVASKLLVMLKSRGMRDRAGRLKSEVGQLVDVLKSLLTWLERLLRQAAEVRSVHGAGTLEEARGKVRAILADFPDALEFRIALHDGSPFSFGTGIAADAPALLAPRASLGPHVAVLPAHPLDKLEPDAAQLPPPERVTINTTATKETELERNWRLGLDRWGDDE